MAMRTGRELLFGFRLIRFTERSSRRLAERKNKLSTTYRTSASIFFLYFPSIWSRYSGLIRVKAKLNAELFIPAFWHSITVVVKICTTSKRLFSFSRQTRTTCVELTRRKFAHIVWNTVEKASSTILKEASFLRVSQRKKLVTWLFSLICTLTRM